MHGQPSARKGLKNSADMSFPETAILLIYVRWIPTMAPGAGRALPAGHCLSSVHVLVRSKRPESCSELWWWILLLLLLVLVLTLLLAVVVVVVVVVIGRR